VRPFGEEEKMRRFVVALLATSALTFAAQAADLPVKAPVYKAPIALPYNWTGFYLGINGGGVWGHSSWDYAVGGSAGHDNSGGLIGGTIGYNYQFPNNWVLGIEGDWGWADVKGSTACPTATFDCKSKIDSIGTLRGRLGYAMNEWLFFASGGLAWDHARIETVNTTGAATPTSGTDTNGETKWNAGWTVGAGVEWGFLPNWSLKVEYLYADFGTHTYIVDNSFAVDSRQTENIVRAGINYRF
jgi:outer membrane immunogenic protein